MSNKGMRDYSQSLPLRTGPAAGIMQPMGPANFPVEDGSARDLLGGILSQLTAMNSARIPHLRSAAIDEDGFTLDWANVGLMDRILIRNKGADSVWIAFDVSGPAVDAFTSDLSFEMQAQESVNIPLCQFFKIGCRCAAGETGLVHAIAFQAAAGNLGGSVS